MHAKILLGMALRCNCALAFFLAVERGTSSLVEFNLMPATNKILLAVTLLSIFQSHSAFGQQVPVTETNLSNGMKMLLVERHDEPSVAGGWVAHVGSANERPGITGIAHLFEHMMFKGTTTIGTTDAPKDFEILAEQEKIRDAMRDEEAKMRAQIRSGKIDDLMKPESWTPRYRELQKQFQVLVDD